MQKKLLKPREINAAARIELMRRASIVNAGFFEAGFKNLASMVAIVQKQYPVLSDDEIKSFWNFRSVDAALLLKMETVLESLKSE